MRDISKISGGLPKPDDQLERARQTSGLVVIGDMTYDTARGILAKDRSVRVGRILGTFLQVFARYPNQVLSTEYLRQQTYDEQVRCGDIVRVNIWNCRRKMKLVGSNWWIVSHKTFGWEFTSRDEASVQS